MLTPKTVVSADHIREMLIPAVKAGRDAAVHNSVLQSILLSIGATDVLRDDNVLHFGQVISLQETFWRCADEDPDQLLGLAPTFAAFANAL